MRLVPRDPYIGVTGFMTEEEVAAAMAAFDRLSSSHRLVMLGFLASGKTLRGETNKWPNRYPRVDEIASLFSAHPRALNLIHYATDDQSTLAMQLGQLVEIGGSLLDGFQLNVAWPTPERLEGVKGKRIVLQLGRHALQTCSGPDSVAARLDDYTELVTDVLIDASGGHGVPVDIDVAEGYLRAIVARHPFLGIGVAGGLSHEGMERLQPLADKFPNVNLDAEGRLRTPMPEDKLVIDDTTAYIAAANSLFKS